MSSGREIELSCREELKMIFRMGIPEEEEEEEEEEEVSSIDTTVSLHSTTEYILQLQHYTLMSLPREVTFVGVAYPE